MDVPVAHHHVHILIGNPVVGRSLLRRGTAVDPRWVGSVHDVPYHVHVPCLQVWLLHKGLVLQGSGEMAMVHC